MRKIMRRSRRRHACPPSGQCYSCGKSITGDGVCDECNTTNPDGTKA